MKEITRFDRVPNNENVPVVVGDSVDVIYLTERRLMRHHLRLGKKEFPIVAHVRASTKTAFLISPRQYQSGMEIDDSVNGLARIPFPLWATFMDDLRVRRPLRIVKPEE